MCVLRVGSCAKRIFSIVGLIVSWLVLRKPSHVIVGGTKVAALCRLPAMSTFPFLNQVLPFWQSFCSLRKKKIWEVYQQDQKLVSCDALASAILLISIFRQLFTFPSLFLGTFTFDTLGTNSDTFDTGNTLDTLNAFDWWQCWNWRWYGCWILTEMLEMDSEVMCQKKKSGNSLPQCALRDASASKKVSVMLSLPGIL